MHVNCVRVLQGEHAEACMALYTLDRKIDRLCGDQVVTACTKGGATTEPQARYALAVVWRCSAEQHEGMGFPWPHGWHASSKSDSPMM